MFTRSLYRMRVQGNSIPLFSGKGIVADSFNRADNASSLGSADTGQAWTAYTGTWGISSNQAFNASSTSTAVAALNIGKGDVTVSVTTAVISTDNGIVVRLSDANNYIRFFFEAGTWFLQKVVANVSTTLGSAAGTNVNGDVISLGASGSNYTGKQNGTTVVTGSDAFNSTATNVGMICSNSTARLDNFSAV